MKALIFNKKVVDIQESEFEIHPSFMWVECDDTISVGYTYDNNTFIAPETHTQTYDELRRSEYPPMQEYLDGIVKGDQAQIDKYIADCLAVKAKYPKE